MLEWSKKIAPIVLYRSLEYVPSPASPDSKLFFKRSWGLVDKASLIGKTLRQGPKTTNHINIKY